MFFLYMVLSLFEGKSVTDLIYCSRIRQLEQHFLAFFKIKVECSFFYCTLFKDGPQILHFTRLPDFTRQIEYTGCILSPLQVLLQLSNANMQPRVHTHMQICAPLSISVFNYSFGNSARFPKI